MDERRGKEVFCKRKKGEREKKDTDRRSRLMIKVLVADDERWIRKGIVRMIDGEKYGITEILEAENVTQAMEIFKKELPDIVLSDVCFPAENGCDLGEMIYKLKPETKIVMISAYDDFNYAKRAIHFRAMDYLLKPVSKEQLNEIIGKCVSRLNEAKGMADGNLAEEAQGNLNVPEGEASTIQVIERMIKDIHKDYAKHYTLSDMAQECHVTEAYFSGLFKRIAGKSPMSYILQVRVEKAKELIHTTEYKMVQIARAVGYEDYQYFSKIFKKVAGETPGEYKARIMKEIEDEENRTQV